MFRIVVFVLILSISFVGNVFCQSEEPVEADENYEFLNHAGFIVYPCYTPPTANQQPSDFFTDPKVLELCEAINNEDLKGIERLIREEKVDPNACGRGGMTPMQWAFHHYLRREKDKCIKIMHELGGDFKSRDSQPLDFFWNPKVLELCEAITIEDLKEIERLVKEENVDPNSTGMGGVTPTMWAFQQSKKSFAKILELGGDPNKRLFSDPESPILETFRHGESLVHRAARMNDEEYLLLTLKFYGSPSQLLNIPQSGNNSLNSNALIIALENYCNRNAEIILERSNVMITFENFDYFHPVVKDVLAYLSDDHGYSDETQRLLLTMLKKGLRWRNPSGEMLIFKLVNRYNDWKNYDSTFNENVPKIKAFLELVDWFAKYGVDIRALAQKYPECRVDAAFAPRIQYTNKPEPYVFDPERPLRRFREERIEKKKRFRENPLNYKYPTNEDVLIDFATSRDFPSAQPTVKSPYFD